MLPRTAPRICVFAALGILTITGLISGALQLKGVHASTLDRRDSSRVHAAYEVQGEIWANLRQWEWAVNDHEDWRVAGQYEHHATIARPMGQDCFVKGASGCETEIVGGEAIYKMYKHLFEDRIMAINIDLTGVDILWTDNNEVLVKARVTLTYTDPKTRKPTTAERLMTVNYTRSSDQPESWKRVREEFGSDPCARRAGKTGQ